MGNIQKNDGGIIMTYKVTFKRFRFDAADTVVYIEAKSAEDAAMQSNITTASGVKTSYQLNLKNEYKF